MCRAAATTAIFRLARCTAMRAGLAFKGAELSDWQRNKRTCPACVSARRSCFEPSLVMRPVTEESALWRTEGCQSRIGAQLACRVEAADVADPRIDGQRDLLADSRDGLQALYLLEARGVLMQACVDHGELARQRQRHAVAALEH